MATFIGKKLLGSRNCKLMCTIVRVHKIHQCFYSSPRTGYFVINSSLFHKTTSTRIFSHSLTQCRHFSVVDKSGLTEIAGDATFAAAHVESTISTQSLGGLSPVGVVEQVLGYLHESAGLPWWASIAVATLIARTLMFPLFVKIQRNSIIMNNNYPQMQVLQMKMAEARKNGNPMEVAKYSNELIIFMKEKNCNPFKSMLAPLAQAPVFISFFFALRQMAELPVETFKHGGALWFLDLTIPDPYFLLPLITSATLFITIELNAEGGISTAQAKTAKNLMRAVPLIILPVVINFPAAILCYWVTSNGITLMQVGLLKIPKVRQLLQMPERIQHTQFSLPGTGKQQKGFVESFKEIWTNSKITREMQSREQVEQMKFRKAGMDPTTKTFQSDPTKQRKSQ